MIDRRRVVKGFTDCPPVIELASLFGLDSESIFGVDSDPGSCLFEQSVVNFQDFVVPSDYSSVLSSGKCRQQVHGRLVETGKSEMVRVNGDGAELGPDTPPSRCVVQGNSESLESENGGILRNCCTSKLTPFASLLMLPNLVDARESDFVSELDFMRGMLNSFKSCKSHFLKPHFIGCS